VGPWPTAGHGAILNDAMCSDGRLCSTNALELEDNIEEEAEKRFETSRKE
jgi:hypothetical protein